MEEPKPEEEEPKAMSAGPMIEEEPTRRSSSKEPATMEVASAPKEETPEEEL